MYNFKVGDYVKYRDRLYPRMGVVVKIEEDDDVVSVFFRYPDFQTMAIRGTLLTKAGTEEYAEYVDNEEDKIARKLMNPMLYKHDDDEKSFEQALDEIINGYNEVTWTDPPEELKDAKPFWVEDEPLKLKENFGVTFNGMDMSMYILNKPTMEYKPVTLGGHKKWQDALKKVYIDMALDTGDIEWFKELTKDDE